MNVHVNGGATAAAPPSRGFVPNLIANVKAVIERERKGGLTDAEIAWRLGVGASEARAVFSSKSRPSPRLLEALQTISMLECLPPPAGGGDVPVTISFAANKFAAKTSGRRTLTWGDLALLLTNHEAGEKDGGCYLPATFRGSERKDEFADEIGIAVIDLDTDPKCGLNQVVTALEARGWAGIVSSTHSHTPDNPRFRIALRLDKPWRAVDYSGQDAAIDAWRELYHAVAKALGFEYDTTCQNPGRLFFLPRHPAGSTPETAIVRGVAVDAHVLVAENVKPNGSAAREEREHVDPETGETFGDLEACEELRRWAGRLAKRFKIVDAIKTRRPDVFMRPSDKIKFHIRCPFRHEHTDPSDDQATIAINAGEGKAEGFRIHCLHAHCAGRDRLGFVSQMIELEWLDREDLTNPAFLLPELVLDPRDPLSSARAFVEATYKSGEHRLIKRHRGAFWLWTGSYYRLADDEKIKAEFWEFFGKARRVGNDGAQVAFKPNRALVGDAFEALQAISQLDGNIEPPAWLNSTDQKSAKEFLPCANGLLHVPTGKLQPSTPEFFGLTASEVSFDKDAQEPEQWNRFLGQLFEDDKQSVQLLQEWFGYCLTADTSHQKILLIVGPKRSGKGTIGRILTALLGGSASVGGPTMSSLGDQFGLESLITKSLAIVSDARIGAKTDKSSIVERLLSISGEDTLDVARKYRSAWTGRLPTRFAILTNELPSMSDGSGALASRYLILNLKKSFYGEEDMGLEAKLKSELAGIMNWAIQGYRRLRERRYFVQPQDSLEAMEMIEELASPHKAFVRKCCDVGSGYEVSADTIFRNSQRWRLTEGLKPECQNWFGRNLLAAVPGLKRTKTHYIGIRSKPNEKPAEETYEKPNAKAMS